MAALAAAARRAARLRRVARSRVLAGSLGGGETCEADVDAVKGEERLVKLCGRCTGRCLYAMLR